MARTPHRFLISVYDTAGTTKQAQIPSGVFSDATVTRQVDGPSEFRFTISADSPNASEIRERRIIKIEDPEKGALGVDVPRLFRVSSLRSQFEEDGAKTLSGSARHIGEDLVDEFDDEETTYAAATVSDLLDLILTGSSAWSAGSVAAAIGSKTIDQFTVGGRTRLQAIRELAAAATCHAVFQDDYTVDLVSTPDTSAATISAVVQSRVNLLDLDVQSDVSRLSTRMRAIGGGSPRLNLAGTRHPILSSNILTTTVEIEVEKLAPHDDAFTARGSARYYVQFPFWSTSEWFQIQDFGARSSAAGNDVLTISKTGTSATVWSAGTGRYPGDPIVVWVDEAGTGTTSNFVKVGWVEARDLGATPALGFERWGWLDGSVEDGSLEYSENVVTDGFFSRRAYSSGKHPGIADIFSFGAATYSENTSRTYLVNGTSSQRVQTNGALEGCVIPFDMSRAANESEHFSAKLGLFLVSGRIRVEAIEGDWPGGVGSVSGERGTVYVPDDGRPLIIDAADIADPSVPIEIEIPAISNALGDAGAILIYQEGDDACDFYLDSIQVEPLQSPSATWFEVSPQRLLWSQAYDELWRTASLGKTIAPTIQDLYLTGDDPFAEIDILDVVRFRAPDYGADENLIVVSKTDNLRVPDRSALTLSTELEVTEDYVALALGREQRAREAQARQVLRQMKERRRILTPKGFVASQPQIVSQAPLYKSEVSRSEKASLISIAFCGSARCGIPFMEKLEVPEGFKAVPIVGFPYESAERDQNSAALKYFSNESQRATLEPAGYFSGTVVGALLATDHAGGAIAFHKLGFAVESVWNKGTPAVTASNFYHQWLPPGTYLNPSMIFFGSDGSGVAGTEYWTKHATNLLIAIVPLRKARLKAAASAGAGNIQIHHAQATDESFGWVEMNGKLKLNPGGANEETVTVLGGQTGSNPMTMGYINLSGTLANDHAANEIVEEAAEGN